MPSTSILRRMLGVAALCALASPAAADTLSGREIRREIIGKRIYLATPLGGELPLNYRRNGTVDATGEAIGLGRFVQPNDRGRWWLRGDNLCQQWESWYDGRAFCFTLTSIGDGRLRWRRDDGETGVARIAR
jgi:hypothetical protein